MNKEKKSPQFWHMPIIRKIPDVDVLQTSFHWSKTNTTTVFPASHESTKVMQDSYSVTKQEQESTISSFAKSLAWHTD